MIRRPALLLACLAALLPALAAQEIRSGDLSLPVEGGHLLVRPLLDNAVRVRFTPAPATVPPSHVLSEEVAAPRARRRDSADSVTLDLARLRVTADRRTGTLTFADAEGRVFLRELPGARRLAASSVQGEPTWSVAQTFDSPPDERLYGLGQFQDGFLNIRDLPRRLTQVNTQIAIPILHSSRGYGLLWHNYGLTEFNPADQPVELRPAGAEGAETAVDVTTTEGSRREVRQDGVFTGRFNVQRAGRHAFFLDVGQAMARRWQVEINGTQVLKFENLWLPPTTSWFLDLPAGEHAVRVVGVKEDRPVLRFRPARAATEFQSPVADAIDYVVFAGRGDEITSAYRRLTGPAPLIPLWALGYIHCRERYKSQPELLANAAEFRTRRLPVDVIVQDWQYWGRHGWNAMRFDEEHYPDPAAMVRTLHEQDLRLMLSVWSKIDPRSELGRAFTERGHYIPGTQWVDFFDPAAAAFYWENFRDKLLPLGIDAWWLDATEPENDDLLGRRTHLGPGETVRNLYPLVVNRTVYDGLRRDDPDRRPLILTRSAFPGQQRYAAATWSGDIGNSWDTLRRQVAAGLNYVVTGLPWWTTDTGGFFRPGGGQYRDAAFHERFLRWLQYSTFTPLMRVHGYQTDTEFWRYGERVEAESRRWLELRYRLLPYIYSESARVSLEHATLMRPLVMDFPNDAEALDQQHQFLFGPALHVAPVLAPGVERWPVYLPRHDAGWFDFWTGEHRAGGQTVEVATPIERLPLHVRAGSILPLGAPVQHTRDHPGGPLELRIYPGADATFTLYEDDGESLDYSRGERSTVLLRWDDRRRTLRLAARQGTFPELNQNRELTVVLVGASPTSATRTLTYTGRATSVRF